MIKKILLSVYLLSVFALPQQANALFDDKEARKKILSLESTMLANDQQTNDQLAALKAQLEALESIVKGQGLADLLNQVDLLNKEIAQLKGDLELANHQIQTMQQRERDLYVDTDGRIRALEEVASEKKAEQEAIQAAEAARLANPELVLFNEAGHYLTTEEYKDAYDKFDAFLKEYPNSNLADEAKYGLGFSQYSLKSYKSSITTQKKLIAAHPDSPKIPDAMMNIGNAQIQLGQVNSAKKTFKTLIKQFPDSELVPTAKKRLKVLSSF